MLKIKKGGILEEKEWVYDEETEEGTYQYKVVTDEGPLRLFASCVLDDDIILRDVLLLLNTNIELYDSVLGNWTQQLVEEGLSEPKQQEDIKELELYWYLTRDKSEGKESILGNIFPSFHGLGNPASDGDKHPWSVMASPVNTLADLPLKLNNQYVIINDEVGSDGQSFVLQGPEFSLGQILFGIVWELSWWGSPEDRDEKAEELEEMTEDILLRHSEEGEPDD